MYRVSMLLVIFSNYISGITPNMLDMELFRVNGVQYRMACEFCDICRKMAVLKEVRDRSGVSEYPLPELKKELCDSVDSAQRATECVAYTDFKATGTSQWEK